MKNLKRFGSLLLTLVLSLSLAVPAFAAEDGDRFSDVPEGAAYAEAVNWAAEQGYVNGYNDGRFGVNDNVASPPGPAVPPLPALPAFPMWRQGPTTWMPPAGPRTMGSSTDIRMADLVWATM